MRVLKDIPIDLIVVDRHSISKETLALVDFIRSGGEIPPIKIQIENQRYKLKDGRHRITAFKLLGRKTIHCKYYDRQHRKNITTIKL